MMASFQDEREVLDVIIRYATALDTHDWALLRTCWADQIDVDYGRKLWTTGDEITKDFAARHTGLRPMHMYGNHTIEDLGPGRAKARTYFRARLLYPDGSLFIRSDGWYDDELTKTDGKWRITRRRIVRHDSEGPGSQPPVAPQSI
jgi:hypothetical protein